MANERLARVTTAVGDADGIFGAAAPPSWRQEKIALVEAFGADDGNSRTAKTTISHLRDNVLPAARLGPRKRDRR